ncbi:Tail protein I [gamma proteobacterium IMCC1989]|nr:Tail protein I [gamma proteobacterium IMCC1989]
MASLLPPNATQLEKDWEVVANIATDKPVNIRTLWDWETCPVEFLPWLAWALSVDDWDANWSEDQKRQSIKESYQIHVKKGTVGSIRRVLKATGFEDVDIVERQDATLHNGEVLRNGEKNYELKETRGFMYQVYLQRPISISQASQVRRILGQTAPVRCYLSSMHYEQALNLHNNTIKRNGEFTRGTA